LLVSATSTLKLLSCAMPPEQLPPPPVMDSPLPRVDTLPLARSTTRSALPLSVKKSCVPFLLTATPAGHLLAALAAPTPSTLAATPMPTNVVVARVVVEVARTRLFPKSAVNTAVAVAAMPLGLKKALAVRSPSANMEEPFPPRVNTVRLGKMPRMRLFERSETYAVPEESVAIPRG
jgi:hypothetical protein